MPKKKKQVKKARPKKKKKEKIRLTEKQKKLVKLISENLSSQGFTKSMTQMMKDAGYSENSAHQQREILSRLEDETNPILQHLIDERDRAIKGMKGKISKAKYRDLVEAIDKLTKNIQLLSGRDTGVNKITIGWEK